MSVDPGDAGYRVGAGPESPRINGYRVGAGPESPRVDSYRVGAGPESPRTVDNLMQRRKKKFQYRGVKSYEIARGRFGFGFTLSGQGPCTLSSVIPGSPAELAGLKPGDNLLTVNTNNVSRLSHGEVVRLISQSQGLIRVQVSEGPNSDTSSEDEEKRRPKHLYRRQLRRENPLTELTANYDNIELYTHPGSRPDREGDRFSDGERFKYKQTIKHFRCCILY
jgi:hypothetical protein